MKKFLLLFTAVLFTAISSNVFGQSTGINPAIGDTKTYTVANNLNSTYAWTLTAAADGSGTDLLLAGTVASGSSTTYTIDLTWHQPTIGTIYYLHVVETASAAAGSCTNHKVLAIQPVNYFEMDIANVDNAGTGISSTFETCAPDVTNIVWNGADPVSSGNATDFTYDYGTVTFYYKITATGIINTDWKPVFTIGHNSAATVTAAWDPLIGGTYANSLSTDGSNNTITVTTGNEFFVKVTVANGTVEENLTAKDFTINLDETNSKDEFDNVVKTTNTDTIDQTITARPNTGAIGY